MLAIECHGLALTYPNGRGVRDVSLQVSEGECYGLLGRNGSGKSTLTRMLVGLARPTAGRLQVMGCDVGRNPRGHLSRVGTCLETVVHWEGLSGRANARFAAGAWGVPDREAEDRIAGLFERAGLAEQGDESVETYSYGMRRKLGIVQALCHDPELLVLDEPTAGIDAQFLLALSEIVRERSRSGLTTWIAGTDADWLAGVATRVGFIEDGAIVTEGATEALVAGVCPLQEVRMKLGTIREIPAPPTDTAEHFGQDGIEIVALVPQGAERVARLLEWVAEAGGDVQGMQVAQGSLRDAFLAKTGRTVGE